MDPDLIRRGCRRGYARQICRDAAQIDTDATQFLIVAHKGGIVEVAWSLERNHHPVAVGVIALGVISIGSGVAPQTTLERQAQALASEYLRNTGNI